MEVTMDGAASLLRRWQGVSPTARINTKFMADFAITTDYVTSRGSPFPSLEQIAQAGWKWIHWCHHWNDDHLYTAAELREIDQSLQKLHLKILDIHGSAGRWRRWESPLSFLRIPGIQLVRNRIEMANRLGCDVVIMHPLAWPMIRRNVIASGRRCGVPSTRLLPDLRRNNVRLAMENMEQDNFDQLEMPDGELPARRAWNLLRPRSRQYRRQRT